MKKLVLAIAIAATLAGGAWWLVKTGRIGGDTTDEIPARLMSKVEKRDIDFSVEVSGDVTPSFQLDVKSEVSGKVKAIHVEPGSTVKSGDLLVEVDDSDLLTEKQSVLTEIDGAKLEMEKDKRNYERSKELFEAKLVSREQFDNLTSEYDIAQNNLVRAQRKLATTEEKLRKTKVTSPIDGTVLVLPIIEGQVVIAAASVNSGTALMTVANLDKLLVQTHVNQVDVARLKVDQPVKLKADSLKDANMTGRINFIAPVATVKNSVKGFAIEATIENPSARLRPGMTVTLNIPIARADSAVAVPISAVFKGDGNERVVYVRNGGSTERREVKVGITNFDFAEIKAGVAEGETILLIEPNHPDTAPSVPVHPSNGKPAKASKKRSS
ncbi:MAG: efflux RND transporter periplasmic adaptor subunit [Chthoniobacteraceae bacterium]